MAMASSLPIVRFTIFGTHLLPVELAGLHAPVLRPSESPHPRLSAEEAVLLLPTPFFAIAGLAVAGL